MMYDVSNEKVDCIIVKDLSRFGREHIETGKYLDYLFPMIGLRFIAVNDNYDTYDKIKDNDMIVPFKNIINAIYSKDISKKVRSSLTLKRQRGEYLGAYAPYGYLLDENRNFVVDPDAAPVVQKIFELYLAGQTISEIMRYLMKENIDTPMNYKVKKGLFKTAGLRETNIWTDCTIKRILSSTMYIGCMEQGKEKSMFLETGKKERVKLPRDQWIIVENTHEPIISNEVFALVQKRLKEDFRPVGERKYTNLFVGKLYCGECGRKMTISTNNRNKKIRYYRCSKRKIFDEKCDLNESIHEKELKNIILTSIKGFINSSLDFDKALTGLNADKEIKLRKQSFEKGIRRLKNELEKNKRQRFNLFDDYVKELIEADEFKFARQTYTSSIESIQERLDAHLIEYEKFNKMFSPDEWIDKFKKYRSEKHLTKEMVDYFIEKITVYNERRIVIEWKFSIDELLNSEEVI